MTTLEKHILLIIDRYHKLFGEMSFVIQSGQWHNSAHKLRHILRVRKNWKLCVIHFRLHDLCQPLREITRKHCGSLWLAPFPLNDTLCSRIYCAVIYRHIAVNLAGDSNAHRVYKWHCSFCKIRTNRGRNIAEAKCCPRKGGREEHFRGSEWCWQFTYRDRRQSCKDSPQF